MPFVVVFRRASALRYMHILFLSGEYPPQPGGVGDYTRRLGLALAVRGCTVSVMTIDQERWQFYRLNEQGSASSIPIEDANQSLAHRKASWNWSCWQDVISALAMLQPDLLHIQYQTGAYGMHPAINLLPWRLRGLPLSPPLVVTFHDLLEPYLFPKAGPVRHWITYRLGRDADGVVATNRADADRLRQETSKKRADLSNPANVALIPIGSNIPVAPPDDFKREAWREQIGVHDGETLIAYFGLLGRSKGADLLLDAIEQQASWRLVIIGGEATAPQDRDYAADLLDQIRQRGLDGRVTRTGQINEAKVSAYLLAADIVALPFRDGASLRRGSLLAALAHGCAIVTTSPHNASYPDSGDQPFLVNETNALLVPIDDADGLYQAINRLVHDQSLCSRLKLEAQALAAHFGWDAIAAQHEALYRALQR